MNYITAIDPDLRKSGVCELNSNGDINILQAMNITDLIDYVRYFRDNTYVIEDVNKIKAMYNRGAKTNNTTIAQNVGMCKGAGTIITDIVTHYAERPPILAPVGLGKTVKNNTKLFNELSGWTKSSNEDMRDAWAIARWHFIQATGKTTLTK
jgi:hypothetical protein